MSWMRPPQKWSMWTWDGLCREKRPLHALPVWLTSSNSFTRTWHLQHVPTRRWKKPKRITFTKLEENTSCPPDSILWCRDWQFCAKIMKLFWRAQCLVSLTTQSSKSCHFPPQSFIDQRWLIIEHWRPASLTLLLSKTHSKTDQPKTQSSQRRRSSPWNIKLKKQVFDERLSETLLDTGYHSPWVSALQNVWQITEATNSITC